MATICILFPSCFFPSSSFTFFSPCISSQLYPLSPLTNLLFCCYSHHKPSRVTSPPPSALLFVLRGNTGRGRQEERAGQHMNQLAAGQINTVEVREEWERRSYGPWRPERQSGKHKHCCFYCSDAFIFSAILSLLECFCTLLPRDHFRNMSEIIENNQQGHYLDEFWGLWKEFIIHRFICKNSLETNTKDTFRLLKLPFWVLLC